MATTTITLIMNNFISFISNLIFPLLIAVLGTQIWNFILEKKKKEAEKQEKLYGPLRFYLMLMKNNTVTREALREDMRKMHKEITKNLPPKEKGEILMKNSSQFSREVAGPAIDEWWSHAQKIMSLLEDFSGLIKKDDWPLIQDFTQGLFLREFVVGKAKSKEISYLLFTDETTTSATRQIFEAVDKLQKKLLD